MERQLAETVSVWLRKEAQAGRVYLAALWRQRFAAQEALGWEVYLSIYKVWLMFHLDRVEMVRPRARNENVGSLCFFVKTAIIGERAQQQRNTATRATNEESRQCYTSWLKVRLRNSRVAARSTTTLRQALRLQVSVVAKATLGHCAEGTTVTPGAKEKSSRVRCKLSAEGVATW